MYDNKLLTLGKIYDDANSLQHYNQQITKLVQNEFTKRNIDFYGYERMINVLTCMNLHIGEMRDKLNVFIDTNSRPGTKIDLII